ncbi:MAG: hypothetical protein JRI66_03320 [Deltaproteobacteria bacterium]|nr:hypothetical protein [Deltaproteobacteria bacterium]
MRAGVVSWGGTIILTLACFILGVNPALAEPDFNEIARQIAKNTPVRIEEFEDLARKISRQELDRVKKQTAAVTRLSPRPDEARLLLFITLGARPAENLERNRRLLGEIMEISPEAVLVLRGLPQGARTLGDLVRHLRKLSGKDGELPKIMLDPRLFRKYGVTVAPTLIYERDGQAIAWCRGIVNVRWLRDRVEKEKLTGDLGQWGATEVIAERDLIEVMQERLAKIDLEAMKQKAMERYWQKQQFLVLPKAKEEKVFYLDATYEVQKDFILPDGKVIARAGDEIDLFKVMPPTFMLVVFDAGDPRQLEWAAETGKKYGGRYRVRYITTTIPDRDQGWKSLARLYDTLDAPVFLLTEEVRVRFKMEHVPSMVRYAKDKHQFEVREVCVP